MGWESNAKKAPILWEKYEYQFPRVLLHHEFCCIFPYCGKCMWEPMNFPYAEVYHRMEIGWKIKHPFYGKSMVIYFPDFPYTTSFVALPHTVRNVWGNSCISHMLKYTIRWKSNEKKAAILWEKYEHQFSRLFPCHGFCCIFSYCGKFTGKPIHFPYCEVYHRMGIG